MIFEKLKSVTGDINIVFTQVHLQEVKGPWPNPCFNLGNGCVHMVWKKRSLRSVCNKPCHVVVFAKQALIADTASVFLRFAWPAVAFQMILLCCVFTAARAEITGWPERTRTVPGGKTPLSGRLHQLSGIFWGIIYETHHFWFAFDFRYNLKAGSKGWPLSLGLMAGAWPWSGGAGWSSSSLCQMCLSVNLLRFRRTHVESCPSAFIHSWICSAVAPSYLLSGTVVWKDFSRLSFPKPNCQVWRIT